jgi:TPR repeat protein
MEFWSQACAEQRHHACRNVVAIEQNDCGAGDVAACMRVGGAVIERSLPSEDPLFALRTFSQACELGQSYGCARLSQLLDAGSMSQLDAACTDEDAQACYILGSINLMSLAGTQDHPAAIRFFERACDLGHAAACNVLGDARRFGVGTTRDRLRAAEAYEQGCARASPVGCASLADLLSSGDGVDRDVSRAQALYLKACRLGMQEACKR